MQIGTMKRLHSITLHVPDEDTGPADYEWAESNVGNQRLPVDLRFAVAIS
jgi:hypothetical protein